MGCAIRVVAHICALIMLHVCRVLCLSAIFVVIGAIYDFSLSDISRVVSLLIS